MLRYHTCGARGGFLAAGELVRRPRERRTGTESSRQENVFVAKGHHATAVVTRLLPRFAVLHITATRGLYVCTEEYAHTNDATSI